MKNVNKIFILSVVVLLILAFTVGCSPKNNVTNGGLDVSSTVSADDNDDSNSSGEANSTPSNSTSFDDLANNSTDDTNSNDDSPSTGLEDEGANTDDGWGPIIG